MVKNIWNTIKSADKTFIIAEAGVNHDGDLNKAKRLIAAAKEFGADAVKFQTFRADTLVSRKASKSPYQKKTTSKIESLHAMLKKLELQENDHRELMKHAKSKGIMFLSTPYDEDSVRLLNKINMPLFKISSSDITNLRLLQFAAKTRKPLVISTGRSSLREVKEAVKTIGNAGNKRVAVLHCVSNYPADFADLNLRAMKTLKKELNIPVGFSDHSLGIEASVAAVALGAAIIEKHLTLNKKDKGPDHKASLEPDEFKAMVTAIRNIESALGHGRKEPAPSEVWGIKNVRKGLVSSTEIKKGTRIASKMISIKRPAAGIAPKDYKKVLGKVAKKDIQKDSPIHWEELKV